MTLDIPISKQRLASLSEQFLALPEGIDSGSRTESDPFLDIWSFSMTHLFWPSCILWVLAWIILSFMICSLGPFWWEIGDDFTSSVHFGEFLSEEKFLSSSKSDLRMQIAGCSKTTKKKKKYQNHRFINSVHVWSFIILFQETINQTNFLKHYVTRCILMHYGML